MPLVLLYEQERRIGGTPASESVKSFNRLAPNRVRFSGMIKSTASYFSSRSPCLQHDIHGYVTIKGTPKHDLYLCEIVVAGIVMERSQKAPIVTGNGSVYWQFLDTNKNIISSNLIKINALKSTLSIKSRIAFGIYHMIIPYNVRTYISSSCLNGAMQIRDLKSITTANSTVMVKANIRYAYVVYPLGTYKNNADNSLSFIPFSKYKYIMKSGNHVWMEEPSYKERVKDKQPPQRQKKVFVDPKKILETKKSCTCYFCKKP